MLTNLQNNSVVRRAPNVMPAAAGLPNVPAAPGASNALSVFVRTPSVARGAGAHQTGMLQAFERPRALVIAKAAMRPAPRTDDVQVVTLSAEEHAKMLAVALRLPSPYSDFEAHAAQSYQMAVSCLSPDNLKALREFRNQAKAPGSILIKNLPRDPELPATPADGRRVQGKASWVSEGCLTGVTQIVGEIYGYTTEKEGELIHNVCPVQRGEKAQSNESSKVDLSLHVENVYFKFRPDHVALYCLRQDHNKEAYTYTADARTALKMMRPEEIAQLQRPVYVTPSPPSHHAAQGGVQWSQPRPLIDGPVERPELLMHLPDMKCLDPVARPAFEKFKAAMNDSKTINGVALEPGDLAIVNNRKAAHGRCFFTPRYDGTDRWLQRVYLSSDLWPARSAETAKMRVYDEIA